MFKKNIIKIIKGAIVATVISAASFFAITELNSIDLTNDYVVETNYSEKINSREGETYVNNALVKISGGDVVSHKGSVGCKPLSLPNGNILYYSTDEGMFWELISPTGETLDSGTTTYVVQDAIVLEDGNIFAIEKTGGWFVYSSDTLEIISQGTTTIGYEHDYKQFTLTQLPTGEIFSLGYRGTWTLFEANGSGGYVETNNKVNFKANLTSGNIDFAVATNKQEVIFHDSLGRLAKVKLTVKTDSTTGISQKGLAWMSKEIWLSDYQNYPGPWKGGNISTLLRMPEERYFASSNNGEYIIFNSNFRVETWGEFAEGEDTKGCKSSLYRDGKVYLIDEETSDYWIIDPDENDPEPTIRGNLGFEGKASGAALLSDNSIYVGGSDEWAILGDGYSYMNDVIDEFETKANLINYTYASGEYITIGIDTYSELEGALRSCVVSRDNMPMTEDVAEIIFYDKYLDSESGEYNYDVIDDENVVWTTDEIVFSVKSTDTNPKIIGQSEIYTIDLEFPLAIKSIEITDISQNRIQVYYEFIISDSNPVIAVHLLDSNDNIVADSIPDYDASTDALVVGSIILDGLDYNTLYEGYYFQVEYKQSLTSDEIVFTSKDLDDSELKPFKTLKDGIQIKNERAIARTDDVTGEWYEIDEESGTVTATLDMGIYDDGLPYSFDPYLVKGKIKEIDKYGVVTPIELKMVTSLVDDPDTIVKETEIIITTDYKENVEYWNLELSLTGEEDDFILVPVYDADGNLLVHSTIPEETTNPNHWVFIIIGSILITGVVVIITVTSIVIYKRHHFHH